MAKEPTPLQPHQSQEADPPAAAVPAAPSSFQPKKLIAIGVPVFLVQLVVVYFLAAKFMSPSSQGSPAQNQPPTEAVKGSANPKEAAEPNLYTIKDIIINPAGTNGSRFLLVTMAFEFDSPGALQEMGKKEVQVRDALNTILTSKTLLELVDVNKREALRVEISKRISGFISTGTLKNVYFSKFIIQ
jgi:flagellar FliL protein